MLLVDESIQRMVGSSARWLRVATNGTRLLRCRTELGKRDCVREKVSFESNAQSIPVSRGYIRLWSKENREENALENEMDEFKFSFKPNTQMNAT